MKRKTLIFVVVAVILVLSLGSYALADLGTKVYDHNITITVEPIEVQVKSLSSLYVHPGQEVKVVYLITNHSTDTDWNLVANLEIQAYSAGAGIGSTWLINGVGYAPGTSFQIARGSQRELEIIFYPRPKTFNSFWGFFFFED